MTNQHILCYDIADPKRLKKVHQVIAETGIALQYSVFYLPLNARQLQPIIERLESIIDLKEDDVRIYPIHQFDLAQWVKVGAIMIEQEVLVL